MAKKTTKIFFLIFSIFLGIMISIVLKDKVGLMSPYTYEKIRNYKEELEIVENQIKTNYTIIKGIEKEIELHGDENDLSQLQEKLRRELLDLKVASADSNLVGNGVKITINDSRDKEIGSTKYGVVHDMDIMVIVNDLITFGADAISINDVRILSNSKIDCQGPTIRINDVVKSTPFVIKAIGDEDKLFTGVSDKDSYVNLLKTVYDMDVTIEIEKRIFIPGKIDRRK